VTILFENLVNKTKKIVIGNNMRIAVVANTSWYLVNFRINLMLTLNHLGHEVIAISPDDFDHSKKLKHLPIIFEPVAISGSGTNPINEIVTILNLYKALKKHKVDVVLSYTPKGNIYSGIAAILCKIPFAPNISGIGRALTQKSFITYVSTLLYRITLKKAQRIFFQNMDDLESFVRSGLASPNKCHRLPGSGVDLTRFKPSPIITRASNSPVFLLVARLLWDKGVGEYVEAARAIKSLYPLASFRLLGFLDVDNPSAVSRKQIQKWTSEGIIEYLGSTTDVRPYFIDSDCVVLPSFYGEGVPRTLLEAAATMRPIITTDSPGCRDTVIDGVTGYLCRPKDSSDLAKKMVDFIKLPPEAKSQMGINGRKRIETEFDEKIVINEYCALINSMV
jgi:glycosyltransferase involved in cell wall biosynthesis